MTMNNHICVLLTRYEAFAKVPNLSSLSLNLFSENKLALLSINYSKWILEFLKH